MDFTWAQSLQYRDYRVQHRYGKYQQVCGLPQNYWWEKDMFRTGGYTNASLSGFSSWSNCAPFDLAGRSRPLANAVLATDSGLSQVVMRLKAGGPGMISAGGVVVTFSVGGGAPQTETFPASVVLCVAEPLPTSCE